jgi:hypothetical protein
MFKSHHKCSKIIFSPEFVRFWVGLKILELRYFAIFFVLILHSSYNSFYSCNLRVFVYRLERFSRLSLVFVGKVRSLPWSGAPERSTLMHPKIIFGVNTYKLHSKGVYLWKPQYKNTINFFKGILLISMHVRPISQT